MQGWTTQCTTPLTALQKTITQESICLFEHLIRYVATAHTHTHKYTWLSYSRRSVEKQVLWDWTQGLCQLESALIAQRNHGIWAWVNLDSCPSSPRINELATQPRCCWRHDDQQDKTLSVKPKPYPKKKHSLWVKDKGQRLRMNTVFEPRVSCFGRGSHIWTIFWKTWSKHALFFFKSRLFVKLY